MMILRSNFWIAVFCLVSFSLLLQSLEAEVQPDESAINPMSHSDALNDICELQTRIYKFVLSENAGWVEHLGLLGKDSTDRRSIGFADSGVWRVISGVEPGDEISSENVVITLRLADPAQANARFRTSGGRIVTIKIDGNRELVRKAKIEFADS